MMIDNLRGKELLNRINDDSQAVIEEIIEGYGDKILKLCFVQLGNIEEAEDATQEVFLKVFKNFFTLCMHEIEVKIINSAGFQLTFEEGADFLF